MPRPLDPETLVYGFSFAYEPRLSPDGTRILYALGQTVGEKRKRASQLWLCDVDGAGARQLTATGESNRAGRWSPDGRWIAFLSDRVKHAGIFVMPADGPGEARELVRGPRDLGPPSWSSDGRQIAYALDVDPANPDATEPEPGTPAPVRVTRRVDYKHDGRGYLGEKRRQLFVVDVASGQRRQVTSGPSDHFDPRWSPDGRWLAAEVPNNSVNSQLGLVEVATGDTTLIGPADQGLRLASWSPSGDRVLVVGGGRRTGQPDFWLYHLAAGELRRVTDDLTILPIGGEPVWLDDRRVLFGGARAAAMGLYILDAETGEVALVGRALAGRMGLSVDAARRRVVQAHVGPDAVGEIAVVDLASGVDRLVTTYSAPVHAEAPPPSWERFELERDGLAIEAWLLKPPDFDPSRRYPLVLDVHGGPHGFYGYAFSQVQRCLATSGFLVVYANPRGSTSYGRRFSALVTGDWGIGDYEDLMAVLDAALERPYVDRARTGIYGYSYGGYMTAWTIGQTDRFKAAVCGAPIFDLASQFGTSDIGHTWLEHEIGGQPHEIPDAYAAHSPSTLVHRARTPTLIVQGEADLRCPLGQAEELFVALLKAGCEAELVRYPGGSHLFPWNGPPEHRVDYLTRVRDWFKRYLGEEVGAAGGEAEPAAV